MSKRKLKNKPNKKKVDAIVYKKVVIGIAVVITILAFSLMIKNSIEDMEEAENQSSGAVAGVEHIDSGSGITADKVIINPNKVKDMPREALEGSQEDFDKWMEENNTEEK